ncbi:MAG: ABC transporter permease [Pyrinomonadaceae bacterium]
MNRFARVRPSFSVISFVIRKLVQGIFMLAAVSAISFALLANAGGDAFTALRDNPQVSDATIERLRETYGLDKPVTIRYFKWVTSFIAGDMGESIHFRVPVGGLVLSKLFYTALLGAASLLIAWSVALLLSYLNALYKNRWLSRFIELVVLLTASMPRIALSLFALAFFVWSSWSTFAVQTGSATSFAISSLVLAVPLIALFLAQSNSELTAAMNEDFVKHARAKGLSESKVILRHASRAALNPLLTIFGLSLGGIIGGTVIVETILGWQGLGALTVTAIRVRDVPLVMGIVVVTTVAVWLGNAFAEVLQMLNDPRLRQEVT